LTKRSAGGYWLLCAAPTHTLTSTLSLLLIALLLLLPLLQQYLGLGTNEQMIIECLASRSNARIREMKAKYDARNSTPLIDRLTSELSGSFEKLIVQLLRAERDEASPADDKMAFLQVKLLELAWRPFL
jgi:Annexin